MTNDYDDDALEDITIQDTEVEFARSMDGDNEITTNTTPDPDISVAQYQEILEETEVWFKNRRAKAKSMLQTESNDGKVWTCTVIQILITLMDLKARVEINTTWGDSQLFCFSMVRLVIVLK
ncbi:hypothetical protein HUJ04_010473 [Dendroctonus ponderosae]|nr:hypothetical protein HUJ04_010473 [Dendroctonus ponderosae]KAH1028799.1 hypothetical protein HUJ05_002130 [Dendroctonus ponderosae]